MSSLSNEELAELDELHHSIYINRLDEVKTSLKKIKTIQFNDKWSLNIASNNGCIEIVRLLLQDSRFNKFPSRAIIYASYKGHLEIVELLLEDYKCDPSHLNNKAIRNASIKKHTRIVELLLFDERVISSLYQKPNFDKFGKSSKYIQNDFKNIGIRLNNHVCILMFGMQDLDMSVLQLIMILDELDYIYYLIPFHIKWNLIVKIKHSRGNII